MIRLSPPPRINSPVCVSAHLHVSTSVPRMGNQLWPTAVCITLQLCACARARGHFVLQQQLCVFVPVCVVTGSCFVAGDDFFGAGKQPGGRPQCRLLRSEGSWLAGSRRVDRCQDCGLCQTLQISRPAALRCAGKRALCFSFLGQKVMC